MNKPNVAKLARNARMAMSKRSPEILTGLGIAGMIMTTVLAVKATPKALRIIETEREERGEMAKKDVVKVAWKCYIPAAVLGATSAACLIGASRVSLRRNAALATAYKLSETALVEYRDKVVETIGEKKERGIREAIAKDKLEKNPVNSSTVIVTGNGDTLCHDAVSGRYFKSSMDKLEKAVNKLNKRMINGGEGYISLNEFYDEVGLSYLPLGDELGWRTDKGLIELSYDSAIATDGTPCLVVGFEIAPKRDYYRAY